MFSVTLCGNDDTLLTTRTMLLEREGFRVEAVHGVAGLGRNASKALILCYSLSSREQREAVALQKRRYPTARILVLGGDVHESLCDGCETLTAYPTPHVLLERARQLVQ